MVKSSAAPKSTQFFKYPVLWVAIGIMLITSWALWPGLSGEFTNWDDDRYVTQNPLLKENPPENILTAFYMGNYHPLTLLFYRAEYQAWRNNPFPYHVVSLILHLLNTLGAFFVFLKLSKNNWQISGLAALFFGVHPLHVESVSWVSERKDVLYAVFYFAAWYTWILFREGNKRAYLFTLGLFILSCLSKGMAVTFVFTLIFTDFLLLKKWTKFQILEWLPFVGIALFFGVMAVFAQKAAGFIYLSNEWTFIEKIVLAARAFFFYLEKCFWPTHLSAFYPYPDKPLSALFWILPFVIIGMAALAYFQRKKYPWYVFALGFYAGNIVIVLQILSVGEQLAADRYFYIASAGLFLGLFMSINQIISNTQIPKWLFPILIVGLGLFAATISRARTRIWKDSLTLWTDTVGKYDNVAIAHYNLGVTWGLERNDYPRAEIHFLKALKAKKNYPQALYNLAIVKTHAGKYEESNQLFEQLRNVNPTYPKLDAGIGYNLERMNQFPQAAEYYAKAVKEEPKEYNNWLGLGINYGKAGNLISADSALAIACELSPNKSEPWVNRGVFRYNARLYREALPFYAKALELHPDHAEAWFNQGSTYLGLGFLDSAILSYNQSLKFNPALAESYINLGNIAGTKNDISTQVKNYSLAAKLGHAGAQQWLSSRNYSWN